MAPAQGARRHRRRAIREALDTLPRPSPPPLGPWELGGLRDEGKNRHDLGCQLGTQCFVSAVLHSFLAGRFSWNASRVHRWGHPPLRAAMERLSSSIGPAVLITASALLNPHPRLAPIPPPPSTLGTIGFCSVVQESAAWEHPFFVSLSLSRSLPLSPTPPSLSLPLSVLARPLRLFPFVLWWSFSSGTWECTRKVGLVSL